MKHRKVSAIKVGSLVIGGPNPVSIQSMTNTDTRDVQATVEQVKLLEEAGCQLVRVAIPDMEAAKSIEKIKAQIRIPLAADIHFDYRLALAAMDHGADKLRINPGNIGDRHRVEKVVNKAKRKGIPIRIGVNAGSISKDLVAKHGGPTAEAMVESALIHIGILEQLEFDQIIVSLKSSHVGTMVEACRRLAHAVPYPMHLGVTEAGPVQRGAIKSAIGIGALLVDGIGETMRVSLTGDPVEEIRVGKEILRALGIQKNNVTLISCPTCGRCEIDLITLVKEVEPYLERISKNITVALMGCAVNGPGEAKEADLGIAGGKGAAVLFRKGKVIRRISEENLLHELLKELNSFS